MNSTATISWTVLCYNNLSSTKIFFHLVMLINVMSIYFSKNILQILSFPWKKSIFGYDNAWHNCSLQQVSNKCTSVAPTPYFQRYTLMNRLVRKTCLNSDPLDRVHHSRWSCNFTWSTAVIDPIHVDRGPCKDLSPSCKPNTSEWLGHP